MPIAAPIAGPYSFTYDSQALGIIEDAAQLEYSFSADYVTGDNLGETIQDGIYRGQNIYLNLVLQEWSAAAAAKAFWPYHATPGIGNFGVHGQAGTLLTSFAKAIVMTAVDAVNTPATPASVTFALALLAPGFPVRTLWGSRLKNVPLRFLILPTEDASVISHFDAS